jgi:hypothetical protein
MLLYSKKTIFTNVNESPSTFRGRGPQNVWVPTSVCKYKYFSMYEYVYENVYSLVYEYDSIYVSDYL